MVTAASLTAAPWRSLSATFAYHRDTDSVLWPVILVAHHRHRNRADDFGVLEVADWCPGQRRGPGSTPSGTSRTAPRRRGRLKAGDTLLRADRKSTRLNSSHGYISYAVFCLKKKKI